jgi:NAD(P)-dependent dehydrogenase (short-subunit alcohol dehydrogenase family)
MKSFKKGEHVVIVGGSSGIGLEVSRQAAKHGSRVTIASRSAENLKVALAELEGISGACVASYQLDASIQSDVIRFFEQILKKIGKIDHLVSTIKPAHISSRFADADIVSHKVAFDAKYWGQYLLALHAIRTQSVSGSIVLTSGIAAAKGYIGFSGTAAINGAIESLVKSLAVELAPIRINAVSPGFIERHPDDTERYRMVEKLGSNIPLNRLGSHAEAAQAYMYLMNNKYTTGSVLAVDGGELCG